MNDRRRADDPRSWQPEQPPDPDPWAPDDELAFGGSSANPELDDYDPQGRVPWGPAYIGAGNYASGDFDPDRQDDYGSGDFRCERGSFGELQRQFDLRTARTWPRPRNDLSSPAPRSERDYPGAPGWNDARDWADPAGFRTFTPHTPAARRGPKNYRRSDERILEDIYLQLLRDPSIDSSDVSVELHRGEATLTGTVPVRSMKHAIEDIVHATPGVEEIHNRVKVNAGPPDPA
jgi:hypothetical protein